MNGLFFNNWIVQLRKGTIELCVLNAIRGSRCYGYDIVKKLKQFDGLVINEGTIYPILSRFKREGLVRSFLEESQEGPARKYYEMTDRGEQLVSEMNDHWKLINRGVQTLGREQES